VPSSISEEQVLVQLAKHIAVDLASRKARNIKLGHGEVKFDGASSFQTNNQNFLVYISSGTVRLTLHDAQCVIICDASIIGRLLWMETLVLGFMLSTVAVLNAMNSRFLIFLTFFAVLSISSCLWMVVHGFRDLVRKSLKCLEHYPPLTNQ